MDRLLLRDNVHDWSDSWIGYCLATLSLKIPVETAEGLSVAKAPFGLSDLTKRI